MIANAGKAISFFRFASALSLLIEVERPPVCQRKSALRHCWPAFQQPWPGAYAVGLLTLGVERIFDEAIVVEVASLLDPAFVDQFIERLLVSGTEQAEEDITSLQALDQLDLTQDGMTGEVFAREAFHLDSGGAFLRAIRRQSENSAGNEKNDRDRAEGGKALANRVEQRRRWQEGRERSGDVDNKLRQSSGSNKSDGQIAAVLTPAAGLPAGRLGPAPRA
jgi:hypothetical protein